MGFSQEEVAFLLGCKNRSNITKYELSVYKPDIEVVFAYQFIFQTAAKELFPILYQKVEKATLQRIQALASRLQESKLARPPNHNNQLLDRKISILQAIRKINEQINV